MKRVNAMVWGIVLLVVGLYLTIGQFYQPILTGSYIWPTVIFFALALFFHLYYFIPGCKSVGLLVPGGIMLVYGVLFLLANLGGSMGRLWPLFILGPALGLLELYVFSRGREGSLVPVVILTAVGAVFLLLFNYQQSFGTAVAIVLIVLGVMLVVSAFFKGGWKHHDHDHDHDHDHHHDHHHDQYNQNGETPAEPPKNS